MGMGKLLRESLADDSADRRDDLVLAAQAALAGGRAALGHYATAQLRVEEKGENDPVTAADHASDAVISAILGDRRPEDSVLSEESAPALGRSECGRLWIVDPLDGTKEFIAHNGEFSVMVGLAEEGAALLGAVYQPAIDRLDLGTVDGGAWTVLDAAAAPRLRPLEIPADAPRRVRFVRSRSHPDERLERLQEALGEAETVISGSVGIKCALIAAGEADVYVHPVPYLKEWDTCAPEAVLRGAGGRVTDCAGGSLRYGKAKPNQPGGIFAARAEVWSSVANLVREVSSDLFADGERFEDGIS